MTLTIIGISIGVAFVGTYILCLQYSNDVLKSENRKLKKEVWHLVKELNEKK